MSEHPFDAEYFARYGPGGTDSYEKSWRTFTFDPASVLDLYRELFGGRPDTALDIGAVNGALVKAFLDKGVDTLGIEKSPYIHAKIRSGALKRRILLGDAPEHLKWFGDRQFDLVVECAAQYLPRKSLRAYLRQVHRVCGRLCCLLVDFKDPDKPPHRGVMVYEARTFWKAELARAGFKHVPGGEGYYYLS